MFGRDWLYRKKGSHFVPPKLEPYSLPASIPQWPQGQGFGSGRINLGEIEVTKITTFEHIWSAALSSDKKKDIGFYKPVDIPYGYCSLGHYCQQNNGNLQDYVLVAREVASSTPEALQRPSDFMLVWSLDDGNNDEDGDFGYFWLPVATEGYIPMGFLVTNKPGKPDVDEVRCVRADLTHSCETYRQVLDISSKYPNLPFRVCSMRPSDRGIMGRGVSVGTFFCSTYWGLGEELYIACLKNVDPTLHAMPNLDQIHALIRHYGPVVYFHPLEVYFPSSVSWFFENGALLFKTGESVGKAIELDGSNLPAGGTNDHEFWIDLPKDGRRKKLKRGNLESTKLYVHVKPALGGAYTDIAMWIFCPFNGPATLKVGFVTIALSWTGQHVGDWEHFTLRICNFSGALHSVYFSQHSGGEWVEARDLEYVSENKSVVYSSKSGHASFPHPGTYIQGSPKIGVGPRNDAAGSRYIVDSSVQYEIVSAEYLGEGVVVEPPWLQYMRLWGPTIIYDSRSELDKIVRRLPVKVGESLRGMFAKFPGELYGEEGPTGPKEKNMWRGDERG